MKSLIKVNPVVLGDLGWVVVIGLLGIFPGCSSTPMNPTTQQPIVPADKPEYFVRGHYPEKAPVWSQDFETFKKTNDGKGASYFLGESGDVNDRVAGCELASLTAKRRIAEQIAQLVTSRIGSAKTGALAADKDSQGTSSLGSDFQDVIASESVAFLSGVQEFGKYWEERDYSPSGGKKRVYLCQVVVTIDDDHLRQAIRRTGKQISGSASDPAAKSLVDSAFEWLDTTFGKVKTLDLLSTDNLKEVQPLKETQVSGEAPAAKASQAPTEGQAPRDAQANVTVPNTDTE